MSTWPAVDQADAPEGYEWRWEPERDGNGYCGDWRTVEPGESQINGCRAGAGYRHPSCGAPSVAKLDRSKDPGKRRWWYYCAEHLYGRMVVDGVIYSKVLRAIGGEA